MVLVDSLVCLPVPCSRRTLVFSLANTAPGIQRRGGRRSRNRRNSSSCGRAGNGDSSSSCVVVLAVVKSGFAAGAAAVAPGLTGGMTKPVVDKAVIVGGGLGGLAAAIQLRKIGIDVQVSWLAGYLSSVFFSFNVFHCICLCLEGFSLLAWFDCCLFVCFEEAFGVARDLFCIGNLVSCAKLKTDLSKP
jgi:hypothetical protein